eukprot:1330574-Karenia_brevis.AAC.1
MGPPYPEQHRVGGAQAPVGTPRLLRDSCKGKKPTGNTIIRAIARGPPPSFMRCPGGVWPQANNNPTIG